MRSLRLDNNKYISLLAFAIVFGFAISNSFAESSLDKIFFDNDLKIQEVLKNGGSPNAELSLGHTLLDAASYGNNKNTIEILLEKGANPNVSSTDGETPLMRVIRKFKDEDLVKLFLTKGAIVNAKNKHGWTALKDAVDSENPNIVKLLIEAGANVSDKTDDGDTALFWASNQEIAQILISKGVDVNALSTNGNNALILQTKYHRLDIVSFLLTQGVNLEYKNNDGETAFILAASGEQASGNVEYPITHFLLNSGADISDKDRYGKTALIYVSGDDSYDAEGGLKKLELVKLLVEKGALVNERAKDGGTALLAAASKGNARIVEFLLESKANPSLGYVDGYTPLMAASSFFGNLDIVNMLLKSGVDINSKDASGKTALDYARQSKKDEIVAALLTSKKSN